MAESSEPSKCPCGFWGTPQTLGLCSKCYKEHQTKTAEADESSGNTAAIMKSNLSTSDLTRAFEKVAASSTTSSSSTSQDAGSSRESSSEKTSDGQNGASRCESDPEQMEACGPDSEPAAAEGTSTDSPMSTEANGTSNKRKRDISEVQDSDRPVQKNKKRCFACKVKLELAIREIGRCKCDYVFCQLHRLPEQHDCIYDHKEKGRQQAKEKMVSPKKHAGTSIKRMDSAS